MTIINLVSETYIRNNAPFNKNVDINDIVNNISIAQEMGLEPILGSTYYTQIQLAFSAQTLTANEITLMEHIKPFVVMCASEMALSWINYQVKNKGIQTQSGDNSASVDTSILFYQLKDLKNRKEWYGTRLERYLYFNQALFPGYQVQSSTQDIYADKKLDDYSAGFSTYDDGCNGYNYCSGFNGFFRRY